MRGLKVAELTLHSKWSVLECGELRTLVAIWPAVYAAAKSELVFEQSVHTAPVREFAGLHTPPCQGARITPMQGGRTGHNQDMFADPIPQAGLGQGFKVQLRCFRSLADEIIILWAGQGGHLLSWDCSFVKKRKIRQV